MYLCLRNRDQKTVEKADFDVKIVPNCNPTPIGGKKMKATESLRLIRLGNQEHSLFHKSVFAVLDRADIPELRPGMPKYQEVLTKEDALFAKPIRMDETEGLDDLNTDRTQTLSSLWYHLKSSNLNWDPAVAQAARRVLNLYKYFRHSFHSNRSSKSEGIVQFLQELGETSYTGSLLDETTAGCTPSADAQLLGLEPWIVRLKELNQAYNALANQRKNVQVRYVMQGDPAIFRRNTDRVYRQLINQLNALVVLNGMEAYEQTVASLNVIIKEFRTPVKLRETAAKKKRQKKLAAQAQAEATSTPPAQEA